MLKVLSGYIFYCFVNFKSSWCLKFLSKKHEDFDHETFRNDIGILKLAEPVTLNNYVQIACLPDPSIKNYPTKSDIDAYAIGWGAVYEGGYIPDSLRNVVITIYNNSMCSNVSTNPNDWDSQICAGEWLGGKDTCQGNTNRFLILGLWLITYII